VEMPQLVLMFHGSMIGIILCVAVYLSTKKGKAQLGKNVKGVI
jgi:hypothetical protein